MKPALASDGRWIHPGGVWRAILVAAAALLLGVVTAAPAVAQEFASSAPKLATEISVALELSKFDGIPHYLAARVVAEDRSAVIGEWVQIRRFVDVFGGRTVTIGKARTDNAGIARIPIEPREDLYAVSASFGGSESFEASSAEDDIAFPADIVMVPDEVPRSGLVDPQLRPLADVMPMVIGAGVLLVWIVLLSLTVLTLMRIRSPDRGDPIAPVQSSAEEPGAQSGPQRG